MSAVENVDNSRLNTLARLPIRERASLVNERLHDFLSGESSVDRIYSIQWRVAWAIGFGMHIDVPAENLHEGSGVIAKATPTAKRSPSYFKRFAPETPLQELIGQIKIVDLALSVASENRNDWQPDECRPLDSKASILAFGALVHLYDRELKAAEKIHHGSSSRGLWEDAVDDAWSRAYLTYWSENATSRYLGINCIPALIAVIACNAIKRLAKELSCTQSLTDRATGKMKEIPIDDNPAKAMEMVEASEVAKNRIAVIAGLLRYLTPRQHLIAQLVWIDGLSQVLAAKRLGCTEANISIHLSDARKRLKSLGFWPEG